MKLRLIPATIGWSWWSISQVSACKPDWRSVSQGITRTRVTHEFINGDETTDTSDVDGVGWTCDDNVTNTVGVEAKVAQGINDAISV